MHALGGVRASEFDERVKAAVTVAAAHADAVDRVGGFPVEPIDALRAHRLLGVITPRDLGGEGRSLADIVHACSALGGACASTGMIFAMHQISLANLIDCASDGAWHRDYMRQAARDQLLFASATCEAGVGDDPRHSLCAVERVGDQYILAKETMMISFGEHADALFITARRDREASPTDQVLAVACKGQYTAEWLNDWDALGVRGACRRRWRMAVKAPVAQIVGTPFTEIAAETTLAISHLLWSAVWFGVAADALARSQAFVSQAARKQPGAQPPGAIRLAAAFNTLFSIETAISDMTTRVAEMRADPRHLNNTEFTRRLTALKVNVSTAAQEVVDAATMVCGLQGYMNNAPYSLGRHLRGIRSARLMIANNHIFSSTGHMMVSGRSTLEKMA